MKKLIVCIAVLMMSNFAQADVLLPLNCPKDKPLDNGQKCYSCNEPTNISGRFVWNDCEEVCPNRKKTNECGESACMLKNAPGPGYFYAKCRGWITCSDIKSLYGSHDGFLVDRKDCLACQNTMYDGSFCYASSCPADKPILQVGTRECLSCSDKLFQKGEFPFDLNVIGCSKCPNKIYNFRCWDLEEDHDDKKTSKDSNFIEIIRW